MPEAGLWFGEFGAANGGLMLPVDRVIVGARTHHEELPPISVQSCAMSVGGSRNPVRVGVCGPGRGATGFQLEGLPFRERTA